MRAHAMPEAGQANTRRVVRATLDNGLRVVIVPNPLAPVAALQVHYQVGSAQCPREFPGNAHAVEHMMFRGSPGLGADQLGAIAAHLGGLSNAMTWPDVTRYDFIVPARDLDLALKVESLRMRAVRMRETDWRLERGAIEQELAASLSSADYRSYLMVLSAMYGGTMYAHPVLGTRASLRKTSAAQLKRFHATWYAPNNATVLIVGDVAPRKALASVRALFGDLPARPLPPRPLPKLRSVRGRRIELDSEEPYASAYLLHRCPGLRDPGYAALRILQEALTCARGPLAAMAFDGLALSAECALDPLPDTGLVFAHGWFACASDARRGLERMRSILADAARHGVDAELVAAARRRAVAALELDKNSIEGLADAWSHAVVRMGLEHPDELARRLEAVTQQEVDELARSLFDPTHAIEVLLCPVASGAAVAGAAPQGGPERLALPPDRPVRLPAWAADALRTLPQAPQAPGAVSHTLDNGLRLVVVRQAGSDTVQLYGRVRGDERLLAPRGDEGIAEQLDALMEFGPRGMTREQFQRRQDGLDATTLRAASRFQLAVPRACFAAALSLLANNLRRPALPADAFEWQRRQALRGFSDLTRSPDYQYFLARDKALLPAGDPALRRSSRRSLRELSVDKLRSYHRRAFRPDVTSIVVVGNIDAADAVQCVERCFGDWKASRNGPDTEFPPVPPNRHGSVHIPDASAVQDRVSMVQTLGVTTYDPDRFALQLGNEVLGSFWSPGRLFHELRDRRGLVYGVGVDMDLHERRGTWAVELACDPDKVGAARDIVLHELRRMQRQCVTESTLRQAKAALLRRGALAARSFEALAEHLLELSVLGKPLDEAHTAACRYRELSAEQVRDAFARHLRLDDMVTLTQGPPA